MNGSAALSWLPDLGWVDWVLLAALAVSVVVGMVRGFIFECLSLAGWVVAWFAAQWAAPLLAPHLPSLQIAPPGSPAQMGVAFGLSFLAALVLWTLLSKLVRMLVHATPLSFPDRVLGGGFGVLRGALLLLAVASVVALTPAAQSPAWQGSQGALWLGQTLQMLKPLLPDSAARLLPA